MACCAAAAYVIYHLISIHKKIDVLKCSLSWTKAETQSRGAETFPEKGHVVCNFTISGMTCWACESQISKSLESLPGVFRADVSLPLGRARVAYRPDCTGPSALIAEVESAGYDAEEVSETETWAADFSKANARNDAEVGALKSTLYRSIYVTTITVVSSYTANFLSFQPFMFALTTSCGFSCGVNVLLCSSHIHKEAWNAIVHFRTDMSVLTSTALLCGLLDAIYQVKSSTAAGASSFNVLSILSTVILGGRFAKAMVSRQVSGATALLASLMPRDASVIAKTGGTSTIVPTSMLRTGDRVLLDPGQSAPADGIIVKGNSRILEVFLHGETAPQPRGMGDMIFAGCLNQESAIEIEVVRSGAGTWLEKALEATMSSEKGKSSMQTMAESLTNYFVRMVLCLAFLAGAYAWTRSDGNAIRGLQRMSIVLLSACPCALGLSVPTCTMLGIAVASHNRIIVNGGNAALDAAAKIDLVLLDKTGTLTEGHMSVNDHFISGNSAVRWQRNQLWQVVAALEKDIEHPVGKALVGFCKSQIASTENVSVVKWSETSIESLKIHEGLGVEGQYVSPDENREYRVVIGSAKFMFLRSISIKADCLEWLESSQFTSVADAVYVAVDSDAVACLTLCDRVREDARDFVMACQRKGLEIGIITGDSRRAADIVARAVGITNDHVWASLLPAEKAHVVEELQRHRSIAMVGDNINDIPALSAASFSIALCSDSSFLDDGATDALVLQDPGANRMLMKVLFILGLAKETRNRINENLLWAMGYNLCAILLSTGLARAFGVGFEMTTLHASFGMSFSSVLILLNSMRLEYWKMS